MNDMTAKKAKKMLLKKKQRLKNDVEAKDIKMRLLTKKNKKKVKCDCCKKKGHTEETCWKKHSKQSSWRKAEELSTATVARTATADTFNL